MPIVILIIKTTGDMGPHMVLFWEAGVLHRMWELFIEKHIGLNIWNQGNYKLCFIDGPQIVVTTTVFSLFVMLVVSDTNTNVNMSFIMSGKTIFTLLTSMRFLPCLYFAVIKCFCVVHKNLPFQIKVEAKEDTKHNNKNWDNDWFPYKYKHLGSRNFHLTILY
ncbi:hypothetical protein ACJX0J_015448 [Zea mays]